MRKILFIIPIIATACTTQVAEKASESYAPVYPVEAEFESQMMPTGAIYAQGSAGLFATDRRAARVGDILTVELSEEFSASKSQAANSSKTDEFGLRLPLGLGTGVTEAMTSGGRNSTFAGSGNASQSNSLKGRMSVSVVRILPGGNLEILGQKKLTLNNGDEYIRLRGVVRPADISSDNIVESDRIAHADIKYIGAGQIADTAKKGWLRQGLDVASPI